MKHNNLAISSSTPFMSHTPLEIPFYFQWGYTPTYYSLINIYTDGLTSKQAEYFFLCRRGDICHVVCQTSAMPPQWHMHLLLKVYPGRHIIISGKWIIVQKTDPQISQI